MLAQASHRDRSPSTTLAYHRLDFLSNNQVITNRLPQAIRRIYGSTDMRQYLCRKFNWRPATCDLVDWLCHGRALNRFPNNVQIFLTRLIHEWLPVQVRQHKINKFHTPLCQMCQQQDETQRHFLQCSHSKYQPINNQFLRAVEKYCQEWETSSDTLRLLLLGLQHWPNPPIDTRDFPKHFRHVIQQQSTIGWKHLLYGRFATEWIFIHESVRNRQNNKRNDGEKWLIGLIVLIWTHQHKRWLLRNKHTHDNTDGSTPMETATTDHI